MVVPAPAPDPRPVTGREAARAELRHLRRVLEPRPDPVLATRGWDLLEKTEWPFFALIFFADAATRFGAYDDARWALERAHEIGIRGARPVLPNGHVLLGLERLAAASGQAMEFSDLRASLAQDIGSVLAASPTGMVESYHSMWWTLDAVPALAALTLRKEMPEVRARWERTVLARALDLDTGLIMAGWHPERFLGTGRPRGCALMMAMPDLQIVSPALASGQWQLAKEYLVRSVEGLTGVREYLEPQDGPVTVDSGRIVLGLGEAASGFGMAAAAAMKDQTVLDLLAYSARIVAPPKWEGDELTLPGVPPVGQAAMLRAKVWDRA